MRQQKSYYAKPSDIQRSWYLFDLDGVVLGRAAAQIANILRGKHHAKFTPGMDTGDFVIVVNADKVRVSGNKETDKVYYSHSGYPGGLKERTVEEQRAKDATQIIRRAVKGMLPQNRIGRAMLSKLKCYAGPEHPHEAQNAIVFPLKETVNA